jgi:hypothetical protein
MVDNIHVIPKTAKNNMVNGIGKTNKPTNGILFKNNVGISRTAKAAEKLMRLSKICEDKKTKGWIGKDFSKRAELVSIPVHISMD